METTADGTTHLRPALGCDRERLLQVYASTREGELAQTPWSEAEKDAFVRMQFDAQDRHYREHFPNAEYSAIELEGAVVGRLWIDRRPEEIRILDITLLPRVQGRGIGTRLLADLLAEADAGGQAVRIHVEQSNRARRLYERLGFADVEPAGPYILMERPCATLPS